jgi:N-methylhydantoinase B
MTRTAPEPQIFDPIAMEVFSNRLLSITEDMNNTLVRSSFSTNIKERRDCSVGLFDGRGRLIAQGTQIPLHLGSLNGGVEAVLKACPLDKIQDGDVFLCNDPYLANGTHLPDISCVTPVFIDGKVEFFAANVGHHSDVGGAVPGSIAAARARSSRKASACRSYASCGRACSMPRL